MNKMLLVSRFRKALSADAGTAAVELALVAPMLLALMLGAVEVGRYADYTIKATNAARAGVQYGAQNIATASDSTGITAAALGDAQSMSGLAATTRTFCTCADGSADAGCVVATCSANHRVIYVQVNTTGTLSSLLNYSGLPAALRSISVSALAIMRVAE